MRRRLERYIPIVLFAILVQLIAPVSALHAVAGAISDPLYMASICSNMSDDGHAKPSDGTGSHPGCCEACGAALSGAVMLDPPPSVFVTLQRRYQRVVWLTPLDNRLVFQTNTAAQARAPPFFS
jgi:hypothetical protein